MKSSNYHIKNDFAALFLLLLWVKPVMAICKTVLNLDAGLV